MPFTAKTAKAFGSRGGKAKSNKPKGFAKRPELAKEAANVRWKKNEKTTD